MLRIFQPVSQVSHCIMPIKTEHGRFSRKTKANISIIWIDSKKSHKLHMLFIGHLKQLANVWKIEVRNKNRSAHKMYAFDAAFGWISNVDACRCFPASFHFYGKKQKKKNSPKIITESSNMIRLQNRLETMSVATKTTRIENRTNRLCVHQCEWAEEMWGRK